MNKIIFLLILITSLAFTPGDDKHHKDGRCSGTKYCSACKNCNYCKHCNAGGICGVCSPESFEEKKPAPKKTQAKKSTQTTKK